VEKWVTSGLQPIFSKRFLVVLAVLFAANLLYGLALALNPIFIYLSVVFSVLYGVFLLFRDEGTEPKKPSSRRGTLALAAILLCSLALRGIGATWGFPILGHADEHVVTINAVEMIERSSIDPDYYNRPNNVSIYASAIIYPVIAKVLSGERVPPSFARDSKPFYFASRLVTAGWGLLMVAAAYFIGSMVAPSVGIIAAVLFALLPPFVEHSHYVTPDVPVTTLLMFVLLYSMRYGRDGRIRDIFVALVFSGVAIAEKYPAVLVLPVLLAVVVFRGSGADAAVFAPRGGAPLRQRKAALLMVVLAVAFVAIGAYLFRHPDLSPSFKDFISSALHRRIPADFAARLRMLSKVIIAGSMLLSVLGVFLRYLRGGKYGTSILVLFGMPFIVFLVTPFLFINLGGTFTSIASESESTHLGADNLGFLGNLLFYAKGYIEAAGIISLVFMAVGIVFAFRERSFLPLLFSVLYWACLSVLSLHWLRWALPMYIGPLLLASIGLHRSFLFLASKIGRTGAIAALGVVCVLPFTSVLLSSVTTTYQFVLKDTRVASQVWSAEHGLTVENTIWDGYTPFKPNQPGTVDYPGSNNAEYVVVSSEMYDRYLGEKKRYKAQADMYASIFKLPLVASFRPAEARRSSAFEFGNIPAQIDLLRRLSGGERAYSGPTILIYQRAS
jgi:hypothetical protein